MIHVPSSRSRRQQWQKVVENAIGIPKNLVRAQFCATPENRALKSRMCLSASADQYPRVAGAPTDTYLTDLQ